MSLVVSVVLLLATGSAAAGSTAVAAEEAAMNSLPSRAAVQQELDRICSAKQTTHTVQAGERVQHSNGLLPGAVVSVRLPARQCLIWWSQTGKNDSSGQHFLLYMHVPAASSIASAARLHNVLGATAAAPVDDPDGSRLRQTTCLLGLLLFLLQETLA
jgi:hypothetical protein